ncbi:MAG: nucleotide sugar dehydrogenase [Candidatus Bathyarchaeia archaeon]
MSTQAINIKPEDISTEEKRSNLTISVFGCGKLGIFHAYLFAEMGFKVICIDFDQTIINKILRGKLPFLKREFELKLKNHLKNGRLNAANDVKSAVSKSNVIVVTVPLRINEKKKVEYQNLEKVCKSIGSSLQKGSLIIIANIVGIGATEHVIKEILENASGFKAGVDFGLAYSPVQGLDGETIEALTNCERLVAATDKDSLDIASAILENITKKGVKKVLDLKLAEASVLFEAVKRDVDAAISAEFAYLCEKMGIDHLKTYGLIKADLPITPLSTLISDSFQDEPYILINDAENLNLKLRLLQLAKEVNGEILKHAVNLAKDALGSCGKTLRRAKIALLDVSASLSMKDSTKKALKELAKILETKGAKVYLYRPYLIDEEIEEMTQILKKDSTEAFEGADCIIIVNAEHDQFKRLNFKKLKVVMRMPAAIIDLVGVVEHDKAEKEGFIFRGFGRGVWTK